MNPAEHRTPSIEHRTSNRTSVRPLQSSMLDVRSSMFDVSAGFLALLALLSLAPLAHAQTNRPSGTVVRWGYGGFLPYVEPGTRFSAIAVGGYHTVALKSDGSVVAWDSTVPARRRC